MLVTVAYSIMLVNRLYKSTPRWRVLHIRHEKFQEKVGIPPFFGQNFCVFPSFSGCFGSF